MKNDRFMNPEDMKHLVETWIEHHRVGRARGKIPDETFWAWNRLYEITLDEPELAWEMILQILATDQTDVTIENLAAGPLEDFLVYHGKAYIDRIERQARIDPAFNELLGGVWRNAISPEVWSRVQKIRKRVW